MWAVIDIDKETVIGVIPPTYSEEEAYKLVAPYSYDLVKMTLENSPAYSQGKYKENKFYPPKEENK